MKRASGAVVFLALVWLTFWASYTREGRAAVRTREAILAGAHARPPATDVAETQDVNGDVHVKTPASLNWKKAVSGASLRAGDLVYVGPQSSVKLFYRKEKSHILLSEESIFEVEPALPASTKHKRVFGKARYDGGLKPRLPAEDGTFSRLVLNPAQTSAEEAPEPATETSGALTVDRKMRSVGFLNLRASKDGYDVRVVARTFPAKLVLVVEPISPAPLLFGFLWKQGKGSPEPVWNATTDGTDDLAFEIPVPSEGRFVFQATSEDDTTVTLPVRIEAVSLANLSRIKLLPSGSTGGQSLLVK